jgi:hypothetical protein
MDLRKSILLGCVIASTACLGLGFGLVGAWGGGLLAVIASSLSWLAAYSRRFGWTDTTALIAAVILGAAGVVMGALPALLVCGVSFALASWDMALFDRALKSSSYLQANSSIERKHYASLGQALVFGLLVAFLGPMIQLQISLGVMVVLVLLALVGLDRLWQLYKK